MKQKRVIWFMVQVLVVLLSTIMVIAPTQAQTTSKPDTGDRHARDSIRQAYREKLKALGDYDKDTITGWLILDGVLIPGPYEVVVVQEDSTVLINGIVATSPAPQPEIPPIDPKYIARDEFRKKRDAGFDSVYAEEGMGAAQRWACEYMRNSPLVDSVYLSRFGDIAVLYASDKYPEHITFTPPGERGPTPEEMEELFTERLQSMGDGLRGSLSHGSLVIKSSTNWYGRTTPYPDSKFAMDELIRITATIPNLEDRITAIKKVVGNDKYARQIAERFKFEPAEEEK